MGQYEAAIESYREALALDPVHYTANLNLKAVYFHLGRLKDAEEIDVVEQQLANSEYVDQESRERAIEHVHEIDDAARQRGMGSAADTKL